MSTIKFLFSIFVSMTLLSITAISQTKRTNTWHFPNAGFDFNYGSLPTAIPRLTPWCEGASCSISDTNGNFLFWSDGYDRVLNKNGDLMEGGDLGGVSNDYFQGPMAFPIPGNERFYYLFTFKYNSGINLYRFKLHYTVIDMQANNGLGKVCDSIKMVPLQDSLTSGITAIHRPNSPDVWLVVHGAGNNKIYSFLVTPQGINPPVVSMAGDNCHVMDGRLKISPCGDRFVKKTSIEINYTLYGKLQVLSFNSQSGIVTEADMFEIPFRHHGANHIDRGFEFSPDCSKFYLSDYHVLYQYDLNAGTPGQILASRYSYELDTTLNPYPWEYVQGDLLLGPDGKLYNNPGDGSGFVGFCAGSYLSIIHNPNLYGEASDFHQNELMMADGDESGFAFGLPNFMVDWLKDPTIKADTYCSNLPVTFSLDLNGSIDSVFWHFNDFYNLQGDNSTAMSPSYTFTKPGTYNVTAKIYFGNLNKVLPYKIKIFKTPEPKLGPDTTFCANEPINLELNAGEGERFNWNGNINPGDSTYQVTAPDTYWVRVLDHGCVGTDTINVIQYQEPVIDTTNISYAVASCGQANGRIEGLQVSGTFSGIVWKNNLGVTVANGTDLTGVSAGIYSLYVYYGDSCSVDPMEFLVKDLNAPIISNIIPTPDHCNLGLGKLEVFASGQGILQYSLDTTNFSLSSMISGLVAGEYYVTVKDVNGCKVMRSVIVPNIDGPLVMDSLTTLEHGYAGDGTITITASGDSLYYVMDGNTQSSGTFTGLSAGNYTIKVVDKWGCERLVFMTVERQPGIVLSAWAGGDYKCREELAFSTITAGNFIDVKEFKVVLKYDNTRLNCTSYHAAPQFPDVSFAINAGIIEVNWQSNVPKTFPGNIPLIDLIFTTHSSGVADIKWDSVYSQFSDGFGNRIADSLSPGVITINNPPELQNLSLKNEFCEGEQALIEFNHTGGTDPIELTWTTPDNSAVQGTSYEIDSISLQQSGTYSILALDANQCHDTLDIPITVFARPTAGWESVDTIWFEHSTQLIATMGYASYQWSTGETSYFITVDKEGKYSVLMETAEGCTALSEVTMATTIVPINVPNAFTPNGDGLNDTFRPLVDKELIRRYHLAIYNKWGQLLFETSNSGKGWDGENAMAGVYVWVISYENRVGKGFEMKGMVSLVR